ncbi:ATP-dependent 6-phosphofructokinase [Trifolium repens]|nr:ATP-dependent 6-phosphofructokinase [Trifolium repens]
MHMSPLFAFLLAEKKKNWRNRQPGDSLLYPWFIPSISLPPLKRCGLKVTVVGIPETIDNDIPVIDRSIESAENGIGVVKLMGRCSGFIAMYATLASRDVDCCLIPESPFYLEGSGGVFH